MTTCIPFQICHVNLTPFSHRTVSLFDMKVHGPKSHAEIETLNIQKVWYDIREEVEGLDMSEARLQGHHYALVSHLLHGYDAGYYGYLT